MSHLSQRFAHVGQKYGDFTVTKSVGITELQCQLTELVHEPTAAQIVHISNDDPENLFCLSFQTIPTTSNGVAHILEHTVLCGSKKFPIKDPFFAMTRRSLNTFMNALTGPDFTCYPAATQSEKDFYNLLDVYLDAVFHPNLQKFSFMQEGCRVEFAVPDDASTHLEYKGVVYNEMKGAMGSPHARMHELLLQALFPDITYGYNSGGDPKDIPSLTYDELKAFHEDFYHPSRCLFFFYGNLPLEQHLDFIEKQILKDTTKVPPLPPIDRQPRFLAPRRVKAHYPIAEDESSNSKTVIAFGWLTCDILDQEETLALSILEFILLDTDASPLKMALLKSGLCKQVSAHIDTDMTEVPFTIVLTGCNEDSIELLETVIRKQLKQVISNGIPLNQIENALHQMEFHRSEITHDHGPFGLSLFMRSALCKQHGASTESGLHIHTLVELIHKRFLENPNYFTDLITKYLLNNTHFVQAILLPSNTLAAEEMAEERQTLDALKASLSVKEIEKIISQANDLVAFQEMQEDIDEDMLPKVTLADVSRTARNFPLHREEVGNLEVLYHNTFTNGIVYADLVYNLPEILEKELPYVRLFVSLINQMGCGGRNYAENLEYIQEHTGGLRCQLMFNLQASDPTEFYPSLCIRGKALHRKAPKLFQLFVDIVNGIDLTDHARIKEVISKQYVALHNGVQHHSMQYAINLSASALDLPSRIAYTWYGIEYYHFIKNFERNFDAMLPELITMLTKIQSKMLGHSQSQLVLTCDAQFYSTLKDHHFYGLDNLEKKPFLPWKPNFTMQNIIPQGRIIPTPIAFTGMTFRTVPYIHPDAAPLHLSAFLCTNLVLHAKVREQGGAYGCSAVANSLAANFYFYAYRDPNITSTLQAFQEALVEIAEGNFTDEDLDEAKLELIQGIDAPIAPGEHGELAYSWLREGKTYEMRAEFRRRLLDATKEEVANAVKTHLTHQFANAVPVVFAGKELLMLENKMLQEKGMPELRIAEI